MWFRCTKCDWETEDIPSAFKMVDVQELVNDCDIHTTYTEHDEFEMRM